MTYDLTGWLGSRLLAALGLAESASQPGHAHVAANVTDFNSASRAQTEAALIAGANITITPAGSGATRTLTVAATGGGGSPAGSGTEVQYRDGASFGAMAGTAWNNANRALTITGATVTANAPILDLSQTWNAGPVTFAGFRFNVTDTASSALSALFSFERGGVPQGQLTKGGRLRLNEGLEACADAGIANPFLAIFVGSLNVRMGSTVTLGWQSTGTTNFGVMDVVLARDAANTLALRNGIAAQTFRVYNTFTDASNGEWLSAGWASNICTIAPTANGTGTVRQLIVRHPPVAVANLPAAGTAGAGARNMVNDATATTFHSIVAGGGANTVPVFSDGTNWRIG